MKKLLKRCFSVILILFLGFLGWSFYKENKEQFFEQKKDEKITIACVGDSLTFGRSYTEDVHLYPTYLAEMLGDGYKVTNYGMGGTCVQEDLAYPYTSTRAYKMSVESQSDILIIMLGTNDIWGSGWRDEETFYKYYIDLIDSYLQTENIPKIYLCTLPKIFMEDNEFLGYELQDKLDSISSVIRRVAKERGYRLIEMSTVTAEHPEWYLEDGLHFNYYGAVGVAETVYDVIEDKVKVACVGDSITFRHGFEEEPENNYPTVLAELLGEDYRVTNFGESGTCVQVDGDCAYVDQKVYSLSLDHNADVLVFMLGTNDSKAWNWNGEEAFRKNYEKLLDSYIKEAKPTKVYICTSPKAFYLDDKTAGGAEFGIQPKIVDKIVRIQNEVAKERGYSVIDIYELSKDNPEWFEEDGIHPTLEGASGIANAVAEQILNDK